jgi:hypothetical protein
MLLLKFKKIRINFQAEISYKDEKDLVHKVFAFDLCYFAGGGRQLRARKFRAAD